MVVYIQIKQISTQKGEEVMARWYAVQENREDIDWGYGSYDFEEAKEMLRNYPDGLIAVIVIEEGVDPVCVEEIKYKDLF